MPERVLPDGRVLTVERVDDTHWHLWIPDEPGNEIVGFPLNGTLADLLGFQVAHEEWPGWIDSFAAEIERSLG